MRWATSSEGRPWQPTRRTFQLTDEAFNLAVLEAGDRRRWMGGAMVVATLVVAVVLGLVHVFGGEIASMLADTHHRWLSVGAGVTVAFVFLYLLPELEYLHHHLRDDPITGGIDEVIYVAAVVGVTLYYGLEHLAYRVRQRHREESEQDDAFGHDYVFWLHMGWYAVYNVIIGALLLHGEQETIRGLSLYAVAMAVHFLTIDTTMRRHHEHVYRRTGRWILAAAVVGGWTLGAAAPVGVGLIALAMGFLSGGLLINAIKDELPSSGRAKFFPFVVGVALFSAFAIVI